MKFVKPEYETLMKQVKVRLTPTEFEVLEMPEELMEAEDITDPTADWYFTITEVDPEIWTGINGGIIFLPNDAEQLNHTYSHTSNYSTVKKLFLEAGVTIVGETTPNLTYHLLRSEDRWRIGKFVVYPKLDELTEGMSVKMMSYIVEGLNSGAITVEDLEDEQ